MVVGYQGYERSAPFYDLFDTKDNIPFFLHYGQLAGEILDIGAGTGRIAIPLAEKGVHVFCVEPSRSMRAIFEEKLSKRSDLKKKIVLIGGDAREFNFGRTFPAAFLSGTFDHFLDEDERTACLQNINKHLVDRGVLIFDVFIGLMEERPISPAGEVVEGNRAYRRFVGGKILPNRIIEVLLVFEVYKGEVLVERVEERSYVGIIDRAEIHGLLGKMGFEVKDEYGSYRWDPYQETDEILIVEAVKREKT